VRLLLIGDIVGKPGREITKSAVRPLKQHRNVDFVIANAENSAGGSGITTEIYDELIEAGVDAITLGDHIYRRREIYEVLESKHNIVKPANYPSKSPGRDVAVIEASNGSNVAIISLLGRVFLKPVDCPFSAADRVLASLPNDVKIILIDMHAEATGEKQLMGRHLDGRVTAVLGTHTHVATADSQVFPFGTAFQCDVGMTGPHDSIIGRRVDRVLETTLTFRPEYFDVASGDNRLNGAIVEADERTGKAISIERLSLSADEVARLSHS
jgi:metallophosphoesterase (TIGR00282 family)